MSQNEILGTENNDFLSDTILDDQIFALGGDDEIEVSSGNDLIDGGSGNDQLIFNYSSHNEDLVFYFHYYDELNHNGSSNINFMETGSNNFTDFFSIERLKIITGSGNDNINLGYDNFSNDQVNAGAGDDFISAGLGNDTVDGGAGFDVLRLDYDQSQTGVVSSLSDSNSGQYSDGINTVNFTNIEALEVMGSNYDDVLVALNGGSIDGAVAYPMNSMIDGMEGEDQLVADYSQRTEDLMFMLNNYGGSGVVDVNSYMTNYYSYINFNNIESFLFNSGSGNDNINLGYDNLSDDEVNAGAGDDWILAGLGNDTLNGGAGYDILRLDYAQSQTGVVSFFSDSNSGQYSDGINTVNFINIEAIDVMGSNYDDVLVAVNSENFYGTAAYPMNSMIDGGAGEDQLVADYSQRTEDLMFVLNNYGASGSVDVHSYMTNYYSYINFNSIESFLFNSGSGNDNINLGYDNFSNDQVNAGAGDDFISAGLGYDTVDGGSGNDTYLFEQGHGVDIISDSAGDNDTIYFGAGITLDNLSLNFNNSDLVFSFNDSTEDKLILENYVDSNDKIENVDIEGQIFTIEEVLVLKSIPDVINDRAGNDFITASLGEDAVNGGAGFDILMVDFYNSQTGIVSSLTDGDSGQYSDGINTLNFSNIEAVHVFGSNYDDVLVALNAENYSDYESTNYYPMTSMIDGGEGKDQLVADYSQRAEDLRFTFNNYGNYGNGSVDVHSSMTEYNSRIDFHNIESFAINSGNGNDEINLGYDNYSDDLVNAGAGNDFITTGLGKDTINGGDGFDILMVDFYNSQTGIVSSLTDGDSGQYSDGINTVNFSNIEAIDVMGSNYDDVLVAVNSENVDGTAAYPMNSMINGGAGEDQLVADYSQRTEDLMFVLNNYGTSGFVDVHSYMTNYYSYINFNSIESFLFNSGSGNDNIDLGYDNFSDDEVNAGAGDDWISTGLGNDTINGGAGNDTYLFNQVNYGTDIISDSSGDNDVIIFDYGLTLKDLSWNFNDNDLIFSFANFPDSQLIIKNYANSVDSIEDIQIEGQTFSVEEILALTASPITIINGSNGQDQLVADYSEYTEDLMFRLDDYSENTSLQINSYITGYSSHVSIDNIGSFVIDSASGNDIIDLGYNYYSDDVINAGAGDDWILAGLGNDTLNGGTGKDIYIYELGHGIDVISDSAGDNDTIYLTGISLYDLRLDFYNDDLTFNFSDFPEDRLIIEDYVNSADSIENIKINGQILSIPAVTIIDGIDGQDQLKLNYVEHAEDLMFTLNDFSGVNNSLDVYSSMTGNNIRIGMDNIGSFVIDSGSGKDNIDLGYGYYSDDVINAGAGDDWILAGLGNDTINGGEGNDTYLFERGHGIDVISDSAGDNDTIYFGAGIYLDNLDWNVEENDLIVSFMDSPDDQLIIEDYLNSADSIENIDVGGQTLSIEEILAPATIGEFGKVSNFNQHSQTIQLDHSYENPVVFALPLSRNGRDPAVVRITDIQNDNFTAYLQEAEYKDGVHTNESFSYIVLEAGTWELDNGSLLEVGMVNTDLVTSQGWESIDFNADFVETPVILSQVQTNLESDFVRTRQNQASIEGFSLSMEEEEALKASGHQSETVGWLAIDPGQGNWGELEYEAGHTGRQVNHRGYNLNFNQDFSDEPSLFASLASFYGSDASGLRYRNLSDTQVQIIVEEDQSLDSETNHTKEIVDFLAISGTGDLTAIAYDPFELS